MIHKMLFILLLPPFRIIMILTIRVIFLISFCLTIVCAEGNQESGPYKIQITHFKACNDSGKNDIFYDIMTEYQGGDKERPCFSGHITLNREVNDELVHKVSVEFMEKETWKEHMNFNFKKGCSDTQKYETNWIQMLNSLNINVTDCPLPKGIYSFKCKTFEGKKLTSQKTMKYGRYRAFKSFWDKDTMLGCMYLEGIVSPA